MRDSTVWRVFVYDICFSFVRIPPAEWFYYIFSKIIVFFFSIIVCCLLIYVICEFVKMHVSLIFIMTLIAGRILQILIKAYQMNQYVRDVPFLPWKLFNRLLTATLMRRDLFSVLEEVLGYRNGFIKFWTGTKLTVACDDPENIKLVLMSKNCVEKPYIYRLIDIAGNGLFSSKG